MLSLQIWLSSRKVYLYPLNAFIARQIIALNFTIISFWLLILLIMFGVSLQACLILTLKSQQLDICQWIGGELQKVNLSMHGFYILYHAWLFGTSGKQEIRQFLKILICWLPILLKMWSPKLYIFIPRSYNLLLLQGKCTRECLQFFKLPVAMNDRFQMIIWKNSIPCY